MAEASVRPDESVADLHRHLLRETTKGLLRTNSEPTELHASSGRREDLLGDAVFLKAPGGFRRQFLIGKAQAEGRQHPAEWQQPLLSSIMRPLIDMGYFERILGIGEDGERLLPVQGQSGTLQTLLALVKSFVGVAVTCVPLAVSEGGWLFSSLVLLALGFVNAHCIWMLVDCRVRTGAVDFGGIAALAAGRVGTLAVQVSLVISQFGTITSYIIFVNKVVGALYGVPSLYSTFAQVCVMVPLGLIRSLHGLEYPNLFADALIFFGLFVIVWYNIRYLAEEGVAEEVQRFRPDTCGLFIGTAVFTFEGIPLMLPVRAAMKQPERFMPLFLMVMTTMVLLYVAFGNLGYLDYGNRVQTTALNNLPLGDALADYVKVAYGCALMFGMPLMFIPAARIVEFWLFGVTEKGARKWSKNVLRACEVVLFAVIAEWGGAYFDKFLALVGALCCAPIAFIYPAWFHLVLCSGSRLGKAVDSIYVILGLFVVVFVLYQIIAPRG